VGFPDSSDPIATAGRGQAPIVDPAAPSRLRGLINTATTTHFFGGAGVQFRTALTAESGRALHNFPFTPKIT
jgi:hypothetical protein